MTEFNEAEYFRRKKDLEEEEDTLRSDISRLRRNIDSQKEMASQNRTLQKELYEASLGSRIQNKIYEIGEVIKQNDNKTLTKLDQKLNDKLKDLKKNNELQEENRKNYLEVKKEGNE
ncbi:hypothetical protein [Ligilactobacillus aviarius]|uniref:hypothetical protein n=1 Tax=Ligilactobacillus aviarius TaxID=1606 RepID=UPI0024BB5C70|nr:hypothetical protein [Ligilactobacillus aviarius]